MGPFVVVPNSLLSSSQFLSSSGEGRAVPALSRSCYGSSSERHRERSPGESSPQWGCHHKAAWLLLAYLHLGVLQGLFLKAGSSGEGYFQVLQKQASPPGILGYSFQVSKTQLSKTTDPNIKIQMTLFKKRYFQDPTHEYLPLGTTSAN